MIDAIEHIQRTMIGITLEVFIGGLDRRRIVERNVEIISEASRRLPSTLKSRHADTPWQKVAGIGNILRHDYQDVIPDALWKVAADDLPVLVEACRSELARARDIER
jgi:uncharacterized protein with HEPN domain